MDFGFNASSSGRGRDRSGATFYRAAGNGSAGVRETFSGAHRLPILEEPTQ